MINIRGLAVLIGLAVFWVFGLAVNSAYPHDSGQWDASDADVTRWYRSLMMPDAPAVSCCGEADAYWADSFEVLNGQYVAIVTDERPDEPRHRPHRDVGERVVIPNHKIKFNEGNPTGHGVLFIGATGAVFCYVPPGGV